MKKIIKLVLGLSFACLSSQAMEKKELRTPEKIRKEHPVSFSPQTITYMVPPVTQIQPEDSVENMDHLHDAWKKVIEKSYKTSANPKANSLFFCTPQFTIPKLIDALNIASAKGVEVRVLVGNQIFGSLKKQEGSTERLNKFKKFVRIYHTQDASQMSLNDLHAKLFLYNIDGEKGYSLGSSNVSGLGLFHNNEITQVTSQDPENYDVLLKDLEKVWNKAKLYNDYIASKGKKKSERGLMVSPLKLGRELLKETPEKKHTVLTALSHNLSGVLMSRLDPKKFEAGDEVWLSTYTFNNQEIADALGVLLGKGVKVRLYVDQDPLKRREGLPQLEKLSELGATIYVYAGDRINHTKFMLIRRHGEELGKEKVISIVSTQNVMKNKKSFDALSVNVSAKVFNETLAIAKSYEENSKFMTLQHFLEHRSDVQPQKKKKQ